MRDVTGKVAFITGGASGIGLGMARVFLDAGMKVAIADNLRAHLDEAAELFKGTNLPVRLLQVDVTDRAAMAAAADETEAAFGKVHLVCNNAGVGPPASMDEASYEDWDWVMGVNLGGVINGVVTFVPRLKAHGEGGHIVNTASMAGIIPLPNPTGIYSASKFAVRGLSENLRLSLAPHGIGVSCLCPGLTQTRIFGSAARAPHGMSLKPPMMGNEPSFDIAGAGMDPLELAAAVLEGVRSNAAYIFPHGEFKDEVAELGAEIVGAFPEVVDADPGRLAFEEMRRRSTAEVKAAIPRT